MFILKGKTILTLSTIANSDFRNGLKSAGEYNGRFDTADTSSTRDVLSELEDDFSSHNERDTSSSVKIVHHVKSGCDSGRNYIN